VSETPVDLVAALADPVRLRLVEALGDGPRRTSELAGRLAMTPAALSRHLNRLRDAGVVRRTDVDDDGRGRRYTLRPDALDPLAAWVRTAQWTSKLASASAEPAARELLARMGGFLDAFGAADVAFFERHVRDDALLVFPGMAPIGKAECLASVTSHPSWIRHDVVGEATAQAIGGASVLTFVADVRTSADPASRRVCISATFDSGEPWRIAHLQWTPVDDAVGLQQS
jgi:DNA-binding transcriptional ArsR family regulator